MSKKNKIFICIISNVLVLLIGIIFLLPDKGFKKNLHDARMEYTVITIQDSVNAIINSPHDQYIERVYTCKTSAFFKIGNVKTVIFSEKQEGYPLIQTILESGDSLAKKANSHYIYIYKKGKLDDVYGYEILEETPEAFVKD